MPTTLTTAMLDLPNDASGKGVVWCFPLEDAPGATSTTDVSTNANSSMTGGGVSIVHGTTLSLGPADTVTGARSQPGATAIVPGAAYAWTNPSSPAWSVGSGNSAVLRQTVTNANLDAVLGSTFSVFMVINMPASSSARTGSIMNIGGTRLAMSSDGKRILSYVFSTPPGGGSITTTAASFEEVTAGIHTIEVNFDGVFMQLIIDGQVQGFNIIGLDASSQASVSRTAVTPGVAVMGSNVTAPVMGLSINNVLVLNRVLDRDEHIRLARLVGVANVAKFPFKHRVKDVRVSAVAAAATTIRGCAGCGGDMAETEAAITNSSTRKFHPGCVQAYGLRKPYGAAASYSDVAGNLARGLVLFAEATCGGNLQYHDGTRFYAGVDGYANPSIGSTTQSAYERQLISNAPYYGDLAAYLHVPPNHWLWQIVRAQIERALTFQVGTPAMADGATASAQTFPAGTHAFGALAPLLFTGSTQIPPLDASYVTFTGGALTGAMVKMAPYISKLEPATWERWRIGAEALGQFIWEGYTIAPPVYWVYTPNGNWALNLAYAMYGVWRVTQDQKWYERFHQLLVFAACPLSANLVAGQTTFNLPPDNIPKNPLGNYTMRGMWNPGTTYNYGDQVGIPYGAAGTVESDWVGNWVSGASYSVGQLVKDTGFTGPSNTTMYYLCKAATSGTTRPSLDTTNWSQNLPGTWAVYLCQSPTGVSSSTAPADDPTKWWEATHVSHFQHMGFMGIQGVAGADTDNWSDYKVYFSEFTNILNTNGPPGTEMQGLPGYDGDYTGLDVNIVTDLLCMMGGMKEHNGFTEEEDWLMVKRWLNGMTNTQLQYTTTSAVAWTVNNTNGAAGGYSTRHNLTDTWRNHAVLAQIQSDGRSDITASHPNITPYNYARALMGNFTSLLQSYGQLSSSSAMFMAQFIALDPNGPKLD